MIRLPASVFRPILLFFAEVNENIVLTFDEKIMRAQTMSSARTHFILLEIERESALAYSQPDKEFCGRPAVLPGNQLSIFLRPTYYETIQLILPTSECDGFKFVCQHPSGQDVIQVISKDVEDDIYQLPDADASMTATLNAAEFRDDINTFSALGFDGIRFVVENATCLTLHAQDPSNSTQARQTTYVTTADWTTFHGGKVTVDVSDDDEKAPSGDKKRRCAKTLSKQRVHRTAWAVRANASYGSGLQVSARFLKQLTACTSFCDNITISSRQFGDAGALLHISYELNREGMEMIAYVAPKIDNCDD